MSSSDIRGIDHKRPQSLVLSSPTMFGAKCLHDDSLIFIVVSQEGMPLEIKNRVYVISFELLYEMEEEELQSYVVGVFVGLGHMRGYVLLDEGGLKRQIHFVLKHVYLDLFCEEDQLNGVYAHPWHVLVKRSQILQVEFVTVKNCSYYAVQITSYCVFQTFEYYFGFCVFV